MRGIKGRLLERGRESFAKANLADQRLTAFYLRQKEAGKANNALTQAMESEAKRLAAGDDALAKGLTARLGWTPKSISSRSS